MNETDEVEFYIEVSAEDSTEDDIDQMTRQLLSELMDTDVTSAELATEETIPGGAKAGEAVTIGSILISVLPNTLPAIIAFVQDWAARSKGRTVKFKGKGIEFEGSPKDLEKILKTLEKQKKKTK